jgi:hypothetical protein
MLAGCAEPDAESHRRGVQMAGIAEALIDTWRKTGDVLTPEKACEMAIGNESDDGYDHDDMVQGCLDGLA